MPFDDIVVRGAQEHNLKSVDIDLPRHRVTVLTGVSGSGKSSLAFDTVFKEGQRRYLESLSAYARQFLGQMEKPRVEHIAGLSPTVAVDQKTTNRNPRSTVGTITEIYDYLRVLYARSGTPHCPKCGEEIERQSPEQVVGRILSLPEGTRFSLLAPVVRGRKGEYREDLVNLKAAGYSRARIDGEIRSLDEPIALSRYVRHTIEVIVDRLTVSHTEEDRGRLAESVEQALDLGKGLLVVMLDEDDSKPREVVSPAATKPKRGGRKKEEAEAPPERAGEWLLSKHGGCPRCGVSLPELEPRVFSFNSTFGACPACKGLGRLLEFDPDLVVPDKTKSIRGGAIATTNDNGYILYSRLGPDGWVQLADHFGFSLDTPWSDLPSETRKMILFGSGRARFEHRWRWESQDGKHLAEGQTTQRFPGIIPIMRASYEHTSAEHIERFMSSQACPACGGRRLRAESLAVTFRGKAIVELAASSVEDLLAFVDSLTLAERESAIAGQLLREIRARLGFLRDVGLSYLTLDRTADTLAGGEAQRLRLAAQLGAGLEGVLYVLDEPSIGLHHRDNEKLLGTLRRLRDRGNTVLVVEHDEETIRSADHVVDFGPGAGVLGGEIVAQGTPDDVAEVERSLTGRYLRGELSIAVPATRRSGSGNRLRIVGAREHNLKGIDVEIPLGTLVCVTGVSGSGKSTLVDDVLKKSLARVLHGAQETPGAHDRIEGIQHVDKVIEIDQGPIGRTPRSNPATYTGVFDHIRALFAALPESRIRGYKPGRFSFNVKGGRCEACGGGGTKVVEMQFLADVEVPCEVCGGKRFNNETLRIRFKGKTISEVLEMTVAEARDFFAALPPAARILQTLVDVGLGYVSLGQSSTTVSGGEAQRIKLAEQLARPSTGRTLYILDEPTTGLHFSDVQRLLDVLQRLVDSGNTVLVVEHNPDVIKVADHLVDMGPEGGAKGGAIIATGTPEEVARQASSYTGQMLVEVLNLTPRPPSLRGNGEPIGPLDAVSPSLRGNGEPIEPRDAVPPSLAGKGDRGLGLPSPESGDRGLGPSPYTPIRRYISVRGARKHNLQGIDVDIPKNALTVVTGVSGSGKSSLAMDTIFAEGQRRFVECLSSYARQFLGRLDDAAVERIDGLAPAIAIDQKYGVRSPRSTVATATEIFDYLRLLFARLGEPRCPKCRLALVGLTSSQIVQKIGALGSGTRGYLLAPVEHEQAGDPAEVLAELKSEGYVRALVDGSEVRLDGEIPHFPKKQKHDVEVVVDRLVLDPEETGSLADSVELALARGRGAVAFQLVGENGALGQRHSYSCLPTCPSCRTVLEEELTPRIFSPNYHAGACSECKGLGVVRSLSPDLLFPRPDLGLLDGAFALVPADRVRYWRHASTLRAVADHYGFDLDRPWRDLSTEHRRLLLFGMRGERLRVRREHRGVASQYTSTHETTWDGIIPMYMRWYSRTRDQKTVQWLEGFMSEVQCPECEGEKLKPLFRAVQLGGKTIGEVGRMSVAQARDFFSRLDLDARQGAIAAQALKEIGDRLQFLGDVGLDYLTLDRLTSTLSGGEAQRIRLATQVGAKLVDALYVLDEPSIGLHQRDVQRLLRTLTALRDLGNTVIVVEHDEEIIRAADHVVDIGPGPGREGGLIVAQGTVAEVSATRGSLTGAYLRASGESRPERSLALTSSRSLRETGPDGGWSPSASEAAAAWPDFLVGPPSSSPSPWASSRGPSRRASSPDDPSLVIRGATEHNLKGIDVAIPLQRLVVVTGVSGSGKSTLVDDILFAALARRLGQTQVTPGAHRGIDGAEAVERVVAMDQHPIGRSPKSNPATYTGVFDQIRNLYALLPESKARGYSKGRFSFNEPKGWCNRCQGEGVIRVSMHFLADVEVICEACGGKRYNAETLAVKYRGKSIADVLDMRIADASEFFSQIAQIRRPLEVLTEVGLGYMRLGQSSSSLSGGEAQRVKLAAELCRPSLGRTLYVLDEPTVGLHFADVDRLLTVLHRLVDEGNTVVVVEHNLDIIAAADHVIDLGPEGGDAGGYVVAFGSPSEVAQVDDSCTGQYLREKLAALGWSAG